MFTLDANHEIKLALVEPSFAEHYFDIIQKHRKTLSQWLAWPPHATDSAFFLHFIQQSLQDYAQGKSLTCAIFYRDELVGNISFNHILHELKKVDIGYWLTPEKQGLGIITQCVSFLTQYAFNTLHIDKIEIKAARDNLPSRAVCERLGFTLEGIIGNAENLNGRIVDHAVYALYAPK
jgi:ribosomal-protein-serine acetyltransferase